jgi:hypothetical protein
MENDDLLDASTVDEVAETPDAPVTPDADASPDVNTDGVKSVEDAIDFGLSEVESRRAGKKPDAEETEEEKTTREAAEAEATANAGKTPEQIAAAKVEADKAKDPAAKEKAAIDDPIPPTAAEKTKERMQTLIDLVKGKDGQIAQHQAFVDQIAATGASSQEFATLMSYMTAVHSDNREHLVLARDLLVSELRGISLKLGEAAPGIDFLKDFPDLQQQVDRGEIRREAAQEIALNRSRAATTAAEKAATAERNNVSAAATKERNDAQTELTALGDELFKKHGTEYTRRYTILEPALEALGMLPPKQWKAAFMRAYNAIPAAAPVTPHAKPPGATPVATPPKGQPLRSHKAPSGESAAGPKNVGEAIEAALQGM